MVVWNFAKYHVSTSLTCKVYLSRLSTRNEAALAATTYCCSLSVTRFTPAHFLAPLLLRLSAVILIFSPSTGVAESQGGGGCRTRRSCGGGRGAAEGQGAGRCEPPDRLCITIILVVSDRLMYPTVSNKTFTQCVLFTFAVILILHMITFVLAINSLHVHDLYNTYLNARNVFISSYLSCFVFNTDATSFFWSCFNRFRCTRLVACRPCT